MLHEEILQFLKKREKLCILSTVTPEGKSESSVVGYAVKDDLSIIMSADKERRKCRNILSNKNVSIVFGWSFTEKNVQYEGTAEIIETGEEYKQLESFYFSTNPPARIFKKPSTILIIVKPTWYRLSNFLAIPPKVEEESV